TWLATAAWPASHAASHGDGMENDCRTFAHINPGNGLHMRFSPLLLAVCVLLLTACNDTPEPKTAAAPPPLVKTVAVRGGSGATLGLSGTVRARVESPLAFQVGGRI